MTLDQRRAAHAAKRLGSSVAPEVAAVASNLPGKIVANGLPMTLAEMKLKAGAPKKVRRDLEEWILRERPGKELGLSAGDDLLTALIGGNSRTVRVAAEEAMAYLAWYKRLAKANRKG